MHWRCSLIKVVMLVAVFIGFSFSLQAWADGTCFNADRVRDFFNKAAAAEKAGKFREAFVGYDLSGFDLMCGGQKHPVLADAQRGRTRIAKVFAAQEEKSGRLYIQETASMHGAQDDCFTDVNITYKEKPSDVSVCVPEKAGAFFWFSRVNDFADADRVMMKMFRAQPENMDTFKIAFRHFTERNNRKADLQKEFGYAADPQYMDELKKTALRNADSALRKEETGFNRKEIDSSGTPASRSLASLKNAQEWMGFIEGKKKGKVVERAEMRGDFLAKNDQVPTALYEAIDYYRFAGSNDKIEAVKAAANRLGDSCSQKGMTIKARQYYEIAGNKEKEKELDRTMKSQAKESAQEFKKSILKDSKGKQKFKKEQDDLEKELGM